MSTRLVVSSEFLMRRIWPASFVVLLTLTAPAHAYIDPNAGGVVFQIVTPVLAVLAASVAFARRQLALLWTLTLSALRGLLAKLLRVGK
jgi:uncharacterized membrane protein